MLKLAHDLECERGRVALPSEHGHHATHASLIVVPCETTPPYRGKLPGGIRLVVTVDLCEGALDLGVLKTLAAKLLLDGAP